MMTPFAYYLRTIPLQPLQSALSAQERGRSECCRWAADHCRSKIVHLLRDRKAAGHVNVRNPARLPRVHRPVTSASVDQ
jgi:hypothetical protein